MMLLKTRLKLVFGFVGVAIFLIVNVQAASISNLVTFNSDTDLNNNFNSDNSPQFSNVLTEGIGNTGAIDVPIGTDDIWTTKQGYSVSGAGDKYTFSAFFKIKENDGYGGLGFTNLATNTTDEFGSAEKGIGVIFHGGGGAFVNNRSYTVLSWYTTKGDLVQGNWYKMIFEVAAKGSSAYDLKLQIWNSDENGVIGNLFTEQSLLNIVNNDIANASVIHGYFSAAGYRMEKIDNFLMNLEGGSTFVEAGLPVVLTSSVGNITTSSAVTGGNVIDEQSAVVTAKGVCWSTNSQPTISNNHTSNGSGLGAFVSNISGLTPVTTYHLRSYATNSQGTSYGSEIVFTTGGSPITPTAKVRTIRYDLVTATPSPTSIPSITPTNITVLTATVNPKITVLPKTGTIQLLVLTADGAPITNAQVTIDGKAYSTDKNGKIDIGDIAVGSHTVKLVVGGQTYSQGFVLSAQTSGIVTVNMGQQIFNWNVCIVGLLLFLIIILIGGYYWYKKSKKNNSVN